MPSISSTTDLTAVIGFTLPASRLDHDAGIYLDFDPSRSRPMEHIRVPMTDLKSELEVPEASRTTAWDQLFQRGYAVIKHESEAMGDIPTEEGTQAYLNETAELMKRALGCSQVIAWNSVVRKNDKDIKVKDVPRQQAPEKGFIPTTRMQPPAGMAHVDQDAVWGHELVGKAAGKPADEFKRAMIVNVWRPLHGPVTNAPLAMLDAKSIDSADVSRHGHLFGIGYDIHHSPKQQWAYIRHQMPDEAILLKCYDTEQSGDGSALYCGHVAVQVDHDMDDVDPGLIRPRESIEVRCVALWE